MSKRIVVALVIVILATVTIMQNPEAMDFTLVSISVHVPKLIVMTAMSIAGFLVGILVSVRKTKRQDTSYPYPHNENESGRTSTLSAEDRAYISEP
jgi:uncharacterized integral membrane protein